MLLSLRAHFTSPSRRFLIWECLAIFLVLPSLMAVFAFYRPVLYTALWLICVYCLLVLTAKPNFSWARLWHGEPWSKAMLRAALLRFVCLTVLAIGLLLWFAPEKVFDFPRSRPQIWALVMLLYPLLSVVPQEMIFRSFFCTRYAPLLPQPLAMIAVNALAFGYVHIIMQNWVAPLLSVIGGVVFAVSYRQHKSLKWASIEHALYGCMLFTVGLGGFFFRGMR
jgi:uncharacterized protein